VDERIRGRLPGDRRRNPSTEAGGAAPKALVIISGIVRLLCPVGGLGKMMPKYEELMIL